MEPLIIRNRIITAKDPIIQAVVNEHWDRGRTHISRKLCKLWDWVQSSGRFKGSCYQAFNWIRVGETKGTAKKGHKHLKHNKIKDVYLYPLHKRFKKLLTKDGISQTV